jgi:hypothetical protein
VVVGVGLVVWWRWCGVGGVPERPFEPALEYRSLDRGLGRTPSLSPGWHLLSRLTRATERDNREPDRGR